MRMMRRFWSSRNLTRTWVTCDRQPGERYRHTSHQLMVVLVVVLVRDAVWETEGTERTRPDHEILSFR